MGFLDTVKNLVSKNAGKVDQAIDKVGDVVDSKTGGKYRDTVDKVQDAARKGVAGLEDKATPTPAESTPQPPKAGTEAAPAPAPTQQQPPTAPPTS